MQNQTFEQDEIHSRDNQGFDAHQSMLPNFNKSNNKNVTFDRHSQGSSRLKRPEQFKTYSGPDPSVTNLESKVRDMDRMMNYMTEQITTLETRLHDTNTKTRETSHFEKDMRDRMETSLKHSEEHTNILTSDFMQKMSA